MQTVLIRVTPRSTDDDFDVTLLADSGAQGFVPLGEPAIMASPLKDATGKAKDVLGEGPVATTAPAFLAEKRRSAAFEAVGEVLADLVLTGMVGTEWDALRLQHGNGLHSLLEIEPEPLRTLPWELMSRNGPVFVDTAFSRALPLCEGGPQELVPLRLLVVEGMRSSEIATDVEVRRIRSSLADFRGRIDAVFLKVPSAGELEQAFARLRPHVFHFVGHGVLQPQTKYPGLQIAGSGHGDGWLITIPYIRSMMKPVPRLAVLNACRSQDGEAPDESASTVRSLALEFLAQGAAAVVGMQGDVKGQAAARFGGELYRALAAGELVDAAVATARRKVYAEVGVPRQERDWILPTLTLRVAPDAVLPLTCGAGVDEVRRGQIERELFEKVRVFVDRVDERLELASAADPDPGTGQPQRLLRIEGEKEAGKTCLVAWARTRCALRGRRVRYVDFKGLSCNFIQALFAICDSPEDVPALGPASDPFGPFHAELHHLLQGSLPPQGGGSAPATRPELPEPLDLGERIPEQIVGSFLTALGAATSAEKPLVLVLDHIRGVLEVDFKTILFENLIRPIERGDHPHLRLVVVATKEEASNYWPSEARGIGHPVPVDLIRPDQFEAYAEELVLALGVEYGPQHEAVIQAVKPRYRERWRPRELEWLQDVARGLPAP